jgi:hypothetical protein
MIGMLILTLNVELVLILKKYFRTGIGVKYTCEIFNHAHINKF